MIRAASAGSPACIRLRATARKHDAARGVVVDTAEHDEATVDRAQGVHDIRDRGGRLALPAESLDEPLEIASRHVGHAPAAEIGQSVKLE